MKILFEWKNVPSLEHIPNHLPEFKYYAFNDLRSFYSSAEYGSKSVVFGKYVTEQRESEEWVLVVTMSSWSSEHIFE